MLEIKNVTKTYNNSYKALDDVNLNVKSGEIFALLGPNGAGKSTAMKAMLGLLNLKSGSVKIDGKDISKFSSTVIPAKTFLVCGTKEMPSLTLS